MLKRDSFNVHCKFGACQKWESACRIGDLEIFWTVSLKAQACFDDSEYWVSAICLKNFEILHFFSGLYEQQRLIVLFYLSCDV